MKLILKFAERKPKLQKYLHCIAVIYFIWAAIQKHKAKKAAAGE